MVKIKSLNFIVSIFLCVIFSANIDAASLSRQVDQCAFCQNSTSDNGGELKKCARCGQVSYCSKKCQVSHWQRAVAGHKSLCRQDEYIPSIVIKNNLINSRFSERDPEIINRLIRSGCLSGLEKNTTKNISIKLELKNAQPDLDSQSNELRQAFDEIAALITVLIFEYRQQIELIDDPQVPEKEKLEAIGVKLKIIKSPNANKVNLDDMLEIVGQFTNNSKTPRQDQIKLRAAANDPFMLNELAKIIQRENQLDESRSLSLLENLVKSIHINIKELEKELLLFRHTQPTLKNAYLLAEYFYNSVYQYSQIAIKNHLHKMKDPILQKNKYQFNMSVFRKLRNAANRYLTQEKHTGSIIPEPYMSGHWFESEKIIDQAPPAEMLEATVDEVLVAPDLAADVNPLPEYLAQDERPNEYDESPCHAIVEEKLQEQPLPAVYAHAVRKPSQQTHKWASPEDISRVVAKLSQKNRAVYDAIMAERIPKLGLPFTNNEVTRLFVELDNLMQEQSIENNFLDKSVSHQHVVHTKNHSKGFLPKSWILHLRLSLIKFGVFLSDFNAKTIKEINECNTLERYRERELQINNFKKELGYSSYTKHGQLK